MYDLIIDVGANQSECSLRTGEMIDAMFPNRDCETLNNIELHVHQFVSDIDIRCRFAEADCGNLAVGIEVEVSVDVHAWRQRGELNSGLRRFLNGS